MNTFTTCATGGTLGIARKIPGHLHDFAYAAPMHRANADPENMLPEDFVCDFCGCSYRDDRPMIEGHRGSLICGVCLSKAYTQVVLHNSGITVPEHIACALCLMNKRGDYWQSPVSAAVTPDGEVVIEATPGACACRWCVERSAKMLAADAEAGWKMPRG